MTYPYHVRITDGREVGYVHFETREEADQAADTKREREPHLRITVAHCNGDHSDETPPLAHA